MKISLIALYLLWVPPPQKKTYLHDGSQVAIQIRVHDFCEHLVNNGCVLNKTRILELPRLKNRELMNAFLLGYSDGDGTVIGGSPVITSASPRFLEDVRRYFDIKYEIRRYTGFCRLTLGTQFYHELMQSYKNSMPRKRRWEDTPKQKRASCQGVYWHKSTRKWLAQLRFKKKLEYLGVFAEHSLAVDAVASAREKYAIKADF
jgi:hypothetical protein